MKCHAGSLVLSGQSDLEMRLLSLPCVTIFLICGYHWTHDVHTWLLSHLKDYKSGSAEKNQAEQDKLLEKVGLCQACIRGLEWTEGPCDG